MEIVYGHRNVPGQKLSLCRVGWNCSREGGYEQCGQCQHEQEGAEAFRLHKEFLEFVQCDKRRFSHILSLFIFENTIQIGFLFVPQPKKQIVDANSHGFRAVRRIRHIRPPGRIR